MRYKPRPWQKLYDTGRWRKLRLVHLRANPLCVMCEKAGRIVAASVVDHVKAHKGNEALFWDQGNWQSLCPPCHDRHKQSEDRTGKAIPIRGADGWPVEQQPTLGSISHPLWFSQVMVPLTIVCGPPASGKTTYVAQHKSEGDIVLDLDAIALQRFGKGAALLPKGQRLDCLKARNQQLARLMAPDAVGSCGMAWLIVTEPTATKRQWWQDKLKPSAIVIIETPTVECIARAKADTKQKRPTDTPHRIAAWWQAYTKRPGETIIRP